MKFSQTIFRGIGQVMFQNNIYSGILFTIGIFYNSWMLGLAALFGTVIGTLTAQILRYADDDIHIGLYGFNGTLTAIAILCFFEINFISIAAIVVGAGLSTVLMYQLKKIIPPFTAPFVIVTWLAIYFLILVLQIPLATSSEGIATPLNFISATGKSFGQVMFQDSMVTGLFFFLGILVNNRVNALYALYAALLGSLAGWLFTAPVFAINEGIMGYNAILCAIALSGKGWRDFQWITIAIILSTLVNIGLAKTGIITLTAPFVLVTWIVYKLKQPTPVIKRLI